VSRVLHHLRAFLSQAASSHEHRLDTHRNILARLTALTDRSQAFLKALEMEVDARYQEGVSFLFVFDNAVDYALLTVCITSVCLLVCRRDNSNSCDGYCYSSSLYVTRKCCLISQSCPHRTVHLNKTDFTGFPVFLNDKQGGKALQREISIKVFGSKRTRNTVDVTHKNNTKMRITLIYCLIQREIHHFTRYVI